MTWSDLPEAEREPAVWELYHENSKLSGSDSALFGRVQAFNETPELKAAVARGLPGFRGSGDVLLRRSGRGGQASFDDVVVERRTATRFGSGKVGCESLADVLHLSLGCSGEGPDADGVVWPLRNAPSAGALYAVDTYVIALAVEDVAPGVYLYRASDDSLGAIAPGDHREKVTEVLSLGERARFAAACVVFCGAFERAVGKYGERGYRFLLLDAGHLAQNLLLASTSRGLASIPAGGFLDDGLNDLLRLDGNETAALHAVCIGVPAGGAVGDAVRSRDSRVTSIAGSGTTA